MGERIAVGITYDGQEYFGWQRQPNQQTIQGCLEQAIFKMSGEEANAVCAGRTDKGVHALNQIVHFDIQKQRDAFVWLNGLNAHLPNDIRVNWVSKVSPDFHARFSARKRQYRYLVLNRKIFSPLLQNRMAWYPYALDIQPIKEAIPYLIGEHDFSAFRGAHCQSHSPIRTIIELEVTQKSELIIFDIQANAFLHHMVRNIVGSLLQVGTKKQSPRWIQDVLASRDRRNAGIMAPAEGLYFINAFYENQFNINKELYSDSLVADLYAICTE